MGGLVFHYALEFEETLSGIKDFVNKGVIVRDDAHCVSVGKSEYDDWIKMGNTRRDGFAEYSLLGCRTSEYLMNFNRFVFHSVAIRWHNRAWLIAAPSGIGKTTQYLNLNKMYPDEITIINGDKPIIELCNDGTAFVHPSPWTGKEHYGGADGAPLGGIFFLKHGENAIAEMQPSEAASFAYFSIFQSFDTTEVIRHAAKMADSLLKRVPLWLLFNRGDQASSKLLYETMKKRERYKNDL